MRINFFFNNIFWSNSQNLVKVQGLKAANKIQSREEHLEV